MEENRVEGLHCDVSAAGWALEIWSSVSVHVYLGVWLQTFPVIPSPHTLATYSARYLPSPCPPQSPPSLALKPSTALSTSPRHRASALSAATQRLSNVSGVYSTMSGVAGECVCRE